ncbi:M48 family metalloprotease [Microlunatus parietis]|uniref:STE24 endopeptidase n=1 Tax=Microlunatus parietis TaxID=682979 RepID=A0A7Y9LEE6_9ACTN|nr:M48 family metalloprotease [Microlunatus parietis]NYE73768.1 STE24 endopeptidase [Microlunatus parietis]
MSGLNEHPESLARRRGVDWSSIATLLVQLPLIVLSLGFMAAVGEELGRALGNAAIGTVAVLMVWLASGALIFLRPVEAALARVRLRARRPLPQESDHLLPIWDSVIRTAGVDGDRFQLWISDTDGINASAASGHIVTVTRAAVQVMPPRELAAVLAHELGHHLGGHPWAGLLAHWYSLPFRALTRLIVLFVRLVALITTAILTVLLSLTRLGGLAKLFFHPLLWICIATMLLMYAPLIVLVVLPIAFLRFFDRYGELRADRTAAELGYGPELLRVFQIWQAQGLDDELPPGGRLGLEDRLNLVLGRLFATHPPLAKRIAVLDARFGIR